MDNSFGEESKIERLKRGLYSRKAPDIIDPGRSKMEKGDVFTPGAWATTEAGRFDVLASRLAHSAGRHHTFAKKLFTVSLAFFGLSIIVAGFVFFGGMNLISSKNVDIKVVGPISVGGGTESSFDIVVVNNNNTDLQSVKLNVQYPKGVRKEGDLGDDVANDNLDMGTIKSGKQSTQTVKLYVFGEKDEVKEFKIDVDYGVKNSNGRFFKEKVYDVTISSAPVIITSTYPKEVNSNQDIDFSIEAAANSTDAPKDFLVSVDYPFGFSFKNASPAPTYGNNTWEFTGLSQGAKQTINISGTIAGQDNEERVFKVSAGTPNADDPRQIGVVFLSSDESITIKKPFIGLDFKIGNSSGDYIAKGSSNINANLNVQNNIPEKIFNVVATVSLSGSAFNGSTVRVDQNGFFRSIDNTISWDKRATNKFAELDPGESQDLSFSLSPLNYQNFPKDSNPEIDVKVTVEGDRILSSGETEHVQSTDEKTIKVSTDLALTQRIVRNGYSISNTGSMPPRVNQKTTYTVVWSLSNSYNSASNAVVSATLPPYVEWTGVFNPSNQNITYNPDMHQVIWNAGTVLSGTGFGTSPKEAAFQISFLPSTSQVGTEVPLIGEAKVDGIDKVVNVNIESTSPSASTRFSSDPAYRIGDEKVAP